MIKHYFINAFLNSKWQLSLTFVLAILLGFYKKGSFDIKEWDEARNGVNAWEMLHNGDYINLYYNGSPDFWNAKPPLLIWLIALSQKIFGFNEFALRLPTALASICFFVYAFKIISFFEKPIVAFMTCLVLMSCKAVYGTHIGLTADFDGLLLVFLTASVYHFIKFVELKNKKDVIILALFTSLAFYTKGVASVVFVPAFILYILIQKQFWVFRIWQTWGAVFLFLLISISWIFISVSYGITNKNLFHGSKNAIETMFMYDTFERFTNPGFDITGNNGNIYLFFFEVLDARLNLWNYIFYIGVFTGCYFILKNKNVWLNYIRGYQFKMVVLAICLITPLSLILTFASSKNNWYLAPVFLYVAFISVKTILFFGKKNNPIFFLAAALFVFTITRQVSYISSLDSEKHLILKEKEILANKKVLIKGTLSQDMLLYLKWLNVTFIAEDTANELGDQKELPIIFDKPNQSVLSNKKTILIRWFGNYGLAVGKTSLKE